jgi:hypothetical protein
MSIMSTILGVCVPPEDVRADIGFFADVTALYSDDRPSSVSLSRSIKSGMHLDRLLTEYGCEALYVLREPVVVMDSPAISTAIAALERLFSQIAAEPERALACAYWECTTEQLVAVASGPEVTPFQDDADDEEGESLQHVIGYLKALMVVLRHAQAHELDVVHGHSHQLDGTEN